MDTLLEKIKILKNENDVLFQNLEEKNQKELNKIVHPYFDIISKIKNNKITKVILKNQDLSDIDVKEIIEALFENESVRVVDFSFNPKIKGKNLNLDELISYNDTISEINFEGCNIEQKVIQKMIPALKAFVEEGGTDLKKINCGKNETKEDKISFAQILK
eukprot:gene1566-12691_t